MAIVLPHTHIPFGPRYLPPPFPLTVKASGDFEMHFIALYIALLHLCVCVVGWGYPIRLVT